MSKQDHSLFGAASELGRRSPSRASSPLRSCAFILVTSRKTSTAACCCDNANSLDDAAQQEQVRCRAADMHRKKSRQKCTFNPADSLLSKRVSLLGKFLDSEPDRDDPEQSTT